MCTSKNSPVILKFLLQLERVETRRLPCPYFNGADLALQNSHVNCVFSASGVLLRPCLYWLRCPSNLTSLSVPHCGSASGYARDGLRQLQSLWASATVVLFQLFNTRELSHGHSTYLSKRQWWLECQGMTREPNMMGWPPGICLRCSCLDNLLGTGTVETPPAVTSFHVLGLASCFQKSGL